jgi:hypothetical protein
MKTINVVEVVGNPCLLAPDKGAQLAAEIQKALRKTSKVAVDFSGYEFLSSSFLNQAFGQLCLDLDWNSKAFFGKVKIIGLQQDDLEELELAIDNAQTRRALVKKGISPHEYFSARLPA